METINKAAFRTPFYGRHSLFLKLSGCEDVSRRAASDCHQMNSTPEGVPLILWAWMPTQGARMRAGGARDGGG